MMLSTPATVVLQGAEQRCCVAVTCEGCSEQRKALKLTTRSRWLGESGNPIAQRACCRPDARTSSRSRRPRVWS